MASMSREVDKLLKDALALPPEARSALADSLLESLDTVLDENVEAAWEEEIQKRIREIDSGKVALVPWSEVRSQLLAAQKKYER